MRWTVTWMPSAQQELALVWTLALDRNSVTFASNQIDRILSVDADAVGDLLFDTVRILIVAPLGVEFEVDTDDLQVRVLSIWDASRGRAEPTGN